MRVIMGEDSDSDINVEDDLTDNNFPYTNGKPHSQEEKRAYHNLLERKRRHQIKDSFKYLRDVIPELKGKEGKSKASRALILKSGRMLIETLLKKLAHKGKVNNDIHNDNQRLEKEIKFLAASNVNKKRKVNDSSSSKSKRINNSGLSRTRPFNLSSVTNVTTIGNSVWDTYDPESSNTSSDISIKITPNYSSVVNSSSNNNGSLSPISITPNNSASSNSERTVGDVSLNSVSTVDVYSSVSNSFFDIDENDLGIAKYEYDIDLPDSNPIAADNQDPLYLNRPSAFDTSLDSNSNKKRIGDICLSKLKADSEEDNFNPSALGILNNENYPAFENIPIKEESIDINFEDILDLEESGLFQSPSTFLQY